VPSSYSEEPCQLLLPIKVYIARYQFRTFRFFDEDFPRHSNNSCFSVKTDDLVVCGPRLTILIVLPSAGRSSGEAGNDDLGQDVRVPALDTQDRRKDSCLVATLWMLWVQDIVVQLLARGGRMLEIGQKLQVSP